MRALWIVLAACVLFAYAAAEIKTTNAFDFRAFYCAGRAVAQHADPYLSEPLHSCERTATDGYYRLFAARVALPAPLPGYDIAVFKILSRLPFAVAKNVWSI